MNWQNWIEEELQKKKLIKINGEYDYTGDIDWTYLDLDDFPIKLRNVYGDFSCACNNIKSLENAPDYVEGDFWCMGNELKFMKGCPRVEGSIWCQDNHLETLEGLQNEIEFDLYCYNNNLENLNGLSKFIGRDLACHNNKQKFTIDEIQNISDVQGEIIYENI